MPCIANPPQEASTSSDAGRQRQRCVSCRTSLTRIRSHGLNIDSEREQHVRSVIVQWINPREVSTFYDMNQEIEIEINYIYFLFQLRASDRICHPCWQRADRHTTRNVERGHGGESEILNPEGAIFLPNLRRAADTQSHCFLPGCNSEERLTVPLWLRVHIFTEYNYYVPQQCRICQFHLRNDNFNILGNDLRSFQHFTVSHIEDFASFVKERK